MIAIAAGALLVTLHLRAVMEEPFDDLMRATNGAHLDVMGPPAAVAEAAALPEVAEAGAPRRLVARRGGRRRRPARPLRAAGGRDGRPPARDRRPAPARGRASWRSTAGSRSAWAWARATAMSLGGERLQIVGVAVLPLPTADGWVTPGQAAALTPAPPEDEAVARHDGTWSPPGCACATPDAAGAVAQRLAAGGELGVSDWLEARADFTDESRRTLAILGAATLLALLATGLHAGDRDRRPRAGRPAPDRPAALGRRDARGGDRSCSSATT